MGAMSEMIRMRTSLSNVPQTKIVMNQLKTNSFAYSELRKINLFISSSRYSSPTYSMPLMVPNLIVRYIANTQKPKMRSRPTSLHQRKRSNRAGRTNFSGLMISSSSSSSFKVLAFFSSPWVNLLDPLRAESKALSSTSVSSSFFVTIPNLRLSTAFAY